ncbi:MAG: SurA N-terminal domain-containing protein [Gammaproteobacteria bacterium]|jgi:peptidyl-prolyl cis-trans isomerase D
MLQQLRDQTQSTGFKVLVVAIILVLTLFGFGATNLFLGTTPSIAEVGDFDITENVLSVEAERERRRVLSQMGPEFDPDDIDRLQLQNYALDQLINRQVLYQAAGSLGFNLSSGEVNQRLLESPAYQVAGQFNEALYRQQIQLMGFTPVQFIEEVRQGLGSELLRAGVRGTSFSLDWETANATALLSQRRDIAFLNLDVSDYLPSVEVSDDDIALRYDEDRNAYLTEESVDVEWVELTLASLQDSVSIDDSEETLREIYEQDLVARADSAERDSDHILVVVDEDSDEAASLAKIQSAAERLATGEDFGAVARELSDDPGSAETGGNLGMMAKGSFDQAFEDALWALEAPGDVSEPVRSEFGYHLIRLKEISSVEVPTFEEERDNILANVRAEAALEVLEARIDELEQRAFEERFGLTETAEALGLEVLRAQGVTQAGTQPVGIDASVAQAIFGSAAVLEALFSPEGVDGENSAVVRLADDRAVVVRASTHYPATQLALAEVKDAVAEQLRLEYAQSLIEADKTQALAQLVSGASVSDVANALGKRWTTREMITRNQVDQAPEEVLEKAFALARPAEGEKSVDATATSTGSALVVVTRVVAGNVSTMQDDLVAQLGQQIQARDQQLEFAAFFASAEEAVGVTRAQ